MSSSRVIRSLSAQEASHCLRPYEVANILSVSREHVLRLLRKGMLPGFRLGRVWLVRRGDLEIYLRKLADAPDKDVTKCSDPLLDATESD